jgi:hypothetical protein
MLRPLRFLLPLVALASTGLPGLAADLTQIERKIAREPTYQTKTQAYCLLVFGSEAKFRVWLVQDGDVLYVDRNGNGDLTEAGKRVTSSGTWFRAGELTEPDGKTKHTELRVRRGTKSDKVFVTVADKRHYSAGEDALDQLHFAASAAEAPVIHFDGPLTMRFYEGPPELQPGGTSEVDVVVGTPGIGTGSFAMLYLCECGTPKPVVPVITFQFPSPEPLGKPITVQCRCADD